VRRSWPAGTTAATFSRDRASARASVCGRARTAVGCRLVGTTGSDGVAGVAAVARLDGAVLARARVAAGLSQSALAVRIGASSKQRIWHWESGHEQPRPHFIPKIARALKLDPLELLNGDPLQPTISALRLSVGLTAAEVSQRATIPRSTYNRIDNGLAARRSDASIVSALANVLSVTESEIIAGIERAREPGRWAERQVSVQSSRNRR
jgi:transcriptional regulator with XRE-family HTH domain